MKTVGIVVATRWEGRPVAKAFGLHRDRRGLFAGRVEETPALLCISGVGREAARAAAYRLCQAGAKSLLSAGFCGALVPELRVGDVVKDRIISVDTPARTSAERRALTEKTHPIAVDMETQAIIEAGTRCGVPIRMLRIVSDEMTDDLTPLFGADIGFNYLKVAFRLLNPRVWPLACRLEKNSQRAAERLVAELKLFFKNPNF